MAEVRAFRAWRYASDDIDITRLTSPPYDVISPEQREAFAQADPHNVVELELPRGTYDPGVPGNRYETAGATWERWRSEGIVAADPGPSVYVVEQRYEQGGAQVARRAFVVEVGLEPFEAGVVLPHERTLSKALGDRFELIKATGANFSQVFSLFEDAESLTDALFEQVMESEPISTATDAEGVISTLWRSADPELAEKLARFMRGRQIFIADGHHRYTTALAYRNLRREQAGTPADAPVGEPAYDHVMMALVNMDDPDLSVLAYNRIADAPGDFDADQFKRDLAANFDISELAPGHPSDALKGHDRPAFLVRTRADERAFLAVLRDDVDLERAISSEHSPAWKSLDVAVLQELILWPLLGIHPDKPETLERLSFTGSPHAALRAAGTHDVAFVLRPTRLDQLRAVSLAGEIMPQKSTYFYPKLLSGLVFRSAD